MSEEDVIQPVKRKKTIYRCPYCMKALEKRLTVNYRKKKANRCNHCKTKIKYDDYERMLNNTIARIFGGN